MSKPDLKELLEKMGGKCVKCGQSDIRLLHVDHIHGQGYLEKEYFADKEKMYGFYLEYFNDESTFLQILCVNCNLARKMAKKEGRSMPNLDIILRAYEHTLMEGNESELDSLCMEFPQFSAIRNRLRARLPLVLDFKKQRKNIDDKISTLEQELPFGFITRESPKILASIDKLERIQNMVIKFIREREVLNKSYTRTSGELLDFLKKEFDLSVEESNQYISRMQDKGIIEEVRDNCFKTVKK